MKTTFRIPTTDYAYIEVVEDKEYTPKAIVERFRELQRAYNGGFGLEAKEWNKLLDNYLLEKGMPSDKFVELDVQQAWMIHELDKAKSRISNKK